jgi:GT2 family glycosyltransferase
MNTRRALMSIQSAHPALDVTVVTPPYNRARPITRAPDSLRAQHRRPTHIIVVDDASTDNTTDVVRSWSQPSGVPVTVETLSRNGGPACAHNRGIELARTRYVAFLDSDDEHLPCTLERLVEPLEEIPTAVLSYGEARVITPEGALPHGLARAHLDLAASPVVLSHPGLTVRSLPDPTSALLKASIIPASATCFRREAILAVGMMPSNLRSGKDWLFGLRLSIQGRFVFQLEDLARHHRHDQNLTHDRAAAEFVAQQKLRSFLALLAGTAGVPLTDEQREQICHLCRRQIQYWRHRLSRLGLPAFLRGLRSYVGARTGGMAEPCRQSWEPAACRGAFGATPLTHDRKSPCRPHPECLLPPKPHAKHPAPPARWTKPASPGRAEHQPRSPRTCPSRPVDP